MIHLFLLGSFDVRHTMPERILPIGFHLTRKPVRKSDANQNPEFKLRSKVDAGGAVTSWSIAKCR